MTETAPKTFLIIDDEVSIRTSVKFMLRSLGHEVIEAEDYESGKELLKKNRFKLSAVISDYNYPGADWENETGGADTVRLINRDYAELPVIVMTAQPGDFKAQAEREGLLPATVLSKPLSKETLTVALDKIFAGKQAPNVPAGTLATRRRRQPATHKTAG